MGEEMSQFVSKGIETKPFPTRGELLHVHHPHVVSMVGLPARGKTYMAKKLERYLNWIGIRTRIFNLGQYRRKATTAYKCHDFFRQDNVEAMALREQCCVDALNDLCNWISSGGEVAVFDATNSTAERRRLIHQVIVEKMGYRLFFVESICDSPEIIEQNIMEVKVNGLDYEGVPKEVALDDFLQRIEHYRRNYDSLDEIKDSDLSYMQIYNTGEKVVVHKHQGHLESRVVYFLMNIHIMPRTIYLTRNGESQDNVLGYVGGDSDLSDRGREYATALTEFIQKQNLTGLRVWTSKMKSSIQTVSQVVAPQERWRSLNEMHMGLLEGLTWSDILDKHAGEVAAMADDKFCYRFPRGESYEDLVARLEPVIMELERQGNVLVVSHQTVLRCLLAYFLDKSAEELPELEVPLHTVLKLTPIAFGCRLEAVHLGVEAVPTLALP